MTRHCNVYASTKKAELYIYIDAKAKIEEVVPEAIAKYCGNFRFVMGLLLKADKKLARADAKDVLAAIADQGFYLQMPPGDEQGCSSAAGAGSTGAADEHEQGCSSAGSTDGYEQRAGSPDA